MSFGNKYKNKMFHIELSNLLFNLKMKEVA